MAVHYGCPLWLSTLWLSTVIRNGLVPIMHSDHAVFAQIVHTHLQSAEGPNFDPAVAVHLAERLQQDTHA